MASNETMRNSDLLQKFYLECVSIQGDRLQFVQESRDGKGLRNVQLPFNFNKFQPTNLKFRLYKSGQKEQEYDDQGLLEALVEGNKDEELERRQDEDIFLHGLDSDYFRQDVDEQKLFPSITYADVTEQDMFGYTPMKISELRSPDLGLWGNMGYRKLRFKISGLDEGASDFQRKLCFYWHKLDSIPIAPLFEDEIRYHKVEKNYYAYINTNQMQEKIRELREDLSSNRPKFIGRFEVHDSYQDESRTYTFPVEIVVHDTDYEVASMSNGILVGKGTPVSVDFGTSATCAAVQSTSSAMKKELLTLSGEAKQDRSSGDNPYENPTNLLIYQWHEVYRQWQEANGNCPFFLTYNKQLDNEKEADYDSGYTVEDEYKDVDSADGRRKMAAILTELKTIPFYLSHGREIKLTSYSDLANVLITDDISKMSDRCFNPIAFYGYLLSRAINTPRRQKIYSNYQVTFPVKFNKEVQEKIRTSLEYGILRALPQSIREARDKKGEPVIKVEMNNQEPVACIGAIIGKGGLVINDESSQAKMFAIYDLGGGTMDFAFGLYRKTTDAEMDEAEENDEDIQEYTVEILGVGGDENIGGEKLIHRLAYEIYKDNRELMEENNIRFVLPTGALMPDGFIGLLSNMSEETADANVNILKEQLARPLFKYHDATLNHLKDIFPELNIKDATHFPIILRSSNGESVELTQENAMLEIKEVDEFLEEILEGTVKDFQAEMKKYFMEHLDRLRNAGIDNFKIEEVNIFLSGNASKQHFVQEKMVEYFPKNQKSGLIRRIGEGLGDEEEGKMYTLNEKTAVAFGQLALKNFIVDKSAIDGGDNERPPFLYNVGYIDENQDPPYVSLISKNDVSKEWKRANNVDKDSGITHLCYTSSPDPENHLDKLLPLEEDVSSFTVKGKRVLYIRTYKEDSLEFRIGNRKEFPDENEEPNSDMVLVLKGI